MSNPGFSLVKAPHEREYYSIPKDIIYNKLLSGNAVKLLLIMLDYGKRPNWKLRQNHLIATSCMAYRKYDTAINNLIEAGYVRRSRKKIGDAYDYEFSSSPVFLDEKFEKTSTKLFEPVAVLQTANCNLQNSNLSLSSYSNVLEETTNNENLVSGFSESFEEVQELEAIKNISPSQKKTLYSKFSPDKIREALKIINVNEADSVFALLYTALKKNYTAAPEKVRNEEAYKIYNQAEEYLEKMGSTPISLGIDSKYAYIYHGTAQTKFFLADLDFKKNFTNAINKHLSKNGTN